MIGRAGPDLNNPKLSMDERKALQALYQPSLVADELVKSQRYLYMNNASTKDGDEA